MKFIWFESSNVRSIIPHIPRYTNKSDIHRYQCRQRYFCLIFVFNIIEGSTKALKNTETSFTSFIWRNKYTPNVYCQNSGKNFSFQYLKNWYLKNFSLNYVSNLSLLHWASKIEKISSSKYNKDLHTHSNWKWGFIFYYTFLAKEMNIFFLLITNVRFFFF